MTSQQIDTALKAAVLAPSPHNTQPWLFEATPEHVDIFLDESRILPVADPHGREARISCGAALLNLRMSLRAQGLAVHMKLLPDDTRPLWLARVRASGCLAVKPDERTLAAAIPCRHTNRRPFRDEPVPGAVRKLLRQAALHEGARLVMIDQPARYSAVAKLLRLAEFTQREDVEFQDELARWVAIDPERLDGVPSLAGGPPPLTEPLVLLREYGENSGKAPREYEQEPLLAVLLTRQDSPHDHVRAGQAMQRVLLAATACDVSASFLSAGVELPSTRASLRALLDGDGHPQVVLRLGYGYPIPRTLRRPVGEVSTCVEHAQ
ncbi:Acg family FMN-binding oxidoreductase [Actinocrispum wychmicini]|uniref:Nitroreductase family protein n=1 Tax=Actinocrispum wychmicini TaxID=1213861 RepID=A0A4R2K6L2_9PSEU|nr:nitroreductase family protein [Actinocrispum wychmicini]TCO61975.1 nitroreductase family protein [Actinocrispum wychmicini]